LGRYLVSTYEGARARVNAFLQAWAGGGPLEDDQVLVEAGLHQLTVHDLRMLAAVPEAPIVNVPTDVAPLIDPMIVRVTGALQLLVSGLQERVERLEAGRRIVDLPRVSFVHDAGCPAAGHVPAIVRGFDGCTCKVGP
jgi:hypothetical protein